jgi:Outer membrane protein beta-barrel domain
MKKLTLSLCALVALGSAAFAGTETYSKESKSVAPPPCPQWYADNEFNLSLWGTYAPTFNEWREDTYLIADHAWGGGIDAKYFMHRYFGIGLQGYLLFPNSDETIDNGLTEVRVAGDHKRTIGSVLGTLTLRFPIGCSRFAPYVWIGGGGIFGGGQDHEFLLDSTQPFGIVNHEFPVSRSKAVGQVGGGFEIRFTPHMGLLNDFSWNIVSGSNNNFGMARTGLNFAF